MQVRGSSVGIDSWKLEILGKGRVHYPWVNGATIFTLGSCDCSLASVFFSSPSIFFYSHAATSSFYTFGVRFCIVNRHGVGPSDSSTISDHGDFSPSLIVLVLSWCSSLVDNPSALSSGSNMSWTGTLSPNYSKKGLVVVHSTFHFEHLYPLLFVR